MANSGKIREELNKSLKKMKGLKNVQPAKGWIRSIREALGMSGRQLAERIQVEGSRITEMEKAEAHGNITLKSLRRAADAMDCELVYAFVPRADLQTTLRLQAEKAARKKLESVRHTMRLEDQGLTEKEDARLVDKMAEEWSEATPRWLWDA